MHHYFEAITNTSGDSLIGYYGRVIDPATNNTVTIAADDNGTPIVTVSGIDNMAKTDAYGNLDFYVQPGTYHLDIYAPNATSLQLRVQNVAMNSTKGDTGDTGPQGDVGASDASFTTLADLKAIDPVAFPSPRLAAPSGADGGVNNGLFNYQLGNFTGRTDVVQVNGIPLTTGALVRQAAVSVNFDGRTADAKLREIVSVKDARMAGGAKGDGVSNDTQSLLAAVNAARVSGMSDGSRTLAGEINLPAGRYVVRGELDVASLGGVAGLTISGAGVGTEIILADAAATLKGTSSRGVTFRDLTIRSLDPTVDGPVSPYGVDMNQSAFTIASGGAALRSWRFERVDFAGLFQCFNVTGFSLCSEFFFDKCTFAQCYRLMNNSNDQAVNWNFSNCNWENEGLDTTKDKNLAAAFYLNKGTSVSWVGGSMVFIGSLVFMNLTAGNSFQSTSHFLNFKDVRMELQPLAGGGSTHAPIIDRVESGYATGGNGPVVGFRDCSIINRDNIPTTVVYAKLWNNCNFLFENCQLEGGQVVGILDGLTATQNGTLRIINTSRITYAENTSSRLNDHDAHAVTIVPPFNGAEGALMLDIRPSALGAAASIQSKYMRAQGPTGSFPRPGTTEPFKPLPVHAVILRMGIVGYENFGAPVTVDLRDQGDTTTYATVSIAGGSRISWVDIFKEVGFQIPATPMMFKISGTDQIIKGSILLEYL